MTDILLQIFPAGAYDLDEGSPVRDSIEAEGAIYVQGEAVIDVLDRELLPDTAVDTLPDWERVLGITPPEGATLAERQAFAAAWLAQSADLSKGHMGHLSSLILGYVPELRETDIIRAGYDYHPIVGVARVAPLSWKEIWHIDLDTALTDINTYERTRLELVLEAAKPANSTVYVGFEGPFLCGVNEVSRDKI